VESALAQDCSDIEIIIFDNASTDGTKQFCQNVKALDSRVRYFRHVSDKGATVNFLSALEQARGEYFMWLADDDWLDASYVKRCIKLHETYPGTALASGGAVFHFSDGTERKGIVVEAKGGYGSLRILKYLSLVRDNSGFYGLIRKTALDKVALRNVLGGDWILVLCLAYLGTIRVDQSVLLHRSPNGASDNMEKLMQSLGISKIAQNFPYLVISKEITREISSNNEIFGSISFMQRYTLVISAVVVLLVSQGLFWRIASSKALRFIFGAKRVAFIRDIVRRIFKV
jgi:glycosyltransferase involved in cell wall biosynthesis